VSVFFRKKSGRFARFSGNRIFERFRVFRQIAFPQFHAPLNNLARAFACHGQGKALLSNIFLNPMLLFEHAGFAKTKKKRAQTRFFGVTLVLLVF